MSNSASLQTEPQRSLPGESHFTAPERTFSLCELCEWLLLRTVSMPEEQIELA